MSEYDVIALCRSAIEEVDFLLERKRDIGTTISHLEAFMRAAEERDQSDDDWHDKFNELWWVLEETYAVALDNEQDRLDAEDIDRIDDSLLEMRHLLEAKIARLERARSGSGDDSTR